MKHKNYLIILFLILASGCRNKNLSQFKNEDIEIERPQIEKLPENNEIFEFEKNWYNKISISFNDKINAIDVLKNIANKLGLKLNFYDIEEIYINYEAKDETFIKILSDITEIANIKITINRFNGKISKDAVYIKNYFIPHLNLQRKVENTTSISSDLGSKDGSSKIQETSSSDFFEEIRKNIELLIANDEESKFFINKTSSVLTIVSKQKTHRMISKYLQKIIKNANKQVLLEVKIYEIALNNNIEFGIDWMELKNYIKMPNLEIKGAIFQQMELKIANVGNADGKFFAKFLAKFGKIQSLSNPSLILMNNEAGIFKAVSNEIYFKFKQDIIVINSNPHMQPSASGNKSYEVHTIPIGVTAYFQLIQDDNEKITILFKPTITEVEKYVDDPGYSIVGGSNSSDPPKIPQIKTREINTMFSLQSGQSIIIGGLRYRKIDNESSNPIISLLSGFYKKRYQETEVVFLVKATKLSNAYEGESFGFMKED